MLARLDVELLDSRLDEADQVTLDELLSGLRWAREAIPRAVADGTSRTGRERRELAQLLKDVAESPQCVSLPASTLESVQWHRDRLPGSS